MFVYLCFTWKTSLQITITNLFCQSVLQGDSQNAEKNTFFKTNSFQIQSKLQELYVLLSRNTNTCVFLNLIYTPVTPYMLKAV